MRSRELARFCGMAAELIANYPEAAAFVARQLDVLISAEAEREDERRREDAEDMARRGFGPARVTRF